MRPMTDRQATGSPQRRLDLELSMSEAELLRTSLMLLESTLGREEADELHEVKALVARVTEAIDASQARS